jgi:hypothetical protein
MTKPFDGEFKLESVPLGLCDIEVVDSRGHTVHNERVLVDKPDVAALTITLDVPCQGDMVAKLVGRCNWTPAARLVNVTSSDGRVTLAQFTSTSALEFRDAGPGPYRLRVEDPAFKPNVFEALTPVDGYVHLKDAVEGPCSLKLDVRDAGGAPILTRYGVTVRRVTTQESDWRERDAVEGSSEDSTLLLDDLPAEPLSIEVNGGPLYGVKTILIDALTPGEPSILDIRMEPNRDWESWGTLVGVFADPSNRGHNNRIEIDIAFVPRDDVKQDDGRATCRTYRIERFLDASEVALTQLDPNDYALVIQSGGPWANDSRKVASKVLTVGRGEDVSFGTLTLPEGRRVRGRLIVPEDASRFTAGLLVLATFECPLVKGCNRHFQRSFASVASDGAFTLEDLGPGVYKAYYRPTRNRTRARNWGAKGSSIFVGSFEVKDRDLESVVLDAREGRMARLNLQLRAGGRPLAAALVRVHRSGDDRFQEYAESDLDGRILLDPMPLGEFELDVQDRANGWTYRVPGRWTVGVETRAQELDIPVVESRITLLNAVGSPLRHTRVWLAGHFGRDSMGDFPERRTDGEGNLTIRLPKAPGSLSISTSEEMSDTTFETAPPAALTVKFGYTAK